MTDISGDGAHLVAATEKGLFELVGEKLEPDPRTASRQFAATGLLRDRDSGMWIATFGHGLLHVHEGRTDAFGRLDGLSSDAVSSLFEDREGGRFQEAENGTLFLDEIGDMPLELQPKLLRALQEREFERLGSGHTIRVNVRVVAATNQDLAQMVSARRFRADLYYRLNVIPIHLPALCERSADIPALVECFVAKFSARFNKPIDAIPEEVMEFLMYHDWPGNIRELQNFIERAVVLSPGRVLRPVFTDLKRMTRQQPDAAMRTLAAAERDHILEVLEQTNWLIGGQQGAAGRLGLPRTTLIYKMKKLGIEGRRSVTRRAVSLESAFMDSEAPAALAAAF